MESRTKFIAIAIFLLIILGMFVFAYLKKSELNVENQNSVEPPRQHTEGPYDHIERIDAKHFFVDGTHTLVGEIPFPTPCDLLNWDVTVAESYPEQVVIDFSVVNNSDVCAQTITDQRFSVSFDASEAADIRAQLEGREVELNLVPADEDETPDDFELFIKG